VSTTPPPAGAASRGADATSRATSARVARNDRADHGSEAFDRALREKAARHEKCASRGDDEAAGNDAPAEVAALGAATPAAAPRAALATLPPPAVSADIATGGTRAALEAALQSNAPVAAPIGGADAAQLWEATVHEPGGTLSLKAARDGSPAWTLTIS